MKEAKKLDIIVSRSELDQVIGLLHAEGVDGYSVIESVTGEGERGLQDGLGLVHTFENVLVICVCSDKTFAALKETDSHHTEEGWRSLRAQQCRGDASLDSACHQGGRRRCISSGRVLPACPSVTAP